MEIVAIIGALIGAVLLFLQGNKRVKNKKFWNDVKKKMADAQEEEEELNKPIEELEDELVHVEIELEDVKDAAVTAKKAVQLLRDKFGWGPPADSNDE